MSTPFSAGPQAIGYLYQARHSLYSIMNNEREEVSVIIEGLDDVAKQDVEGLTLEQLKHHVNKKATLTIGSPEIWKTLRVWSDGMRKSRWDPSKVKLHLITTAAVPVGSVVACLRDSKERDVKKAHAALVQFAESSGNTDLVSSFDAFQALSEEEQVSLLEVMFVQDQAPTIADLPNLIKNKIKWGVRPGHIDPVYERLEGWWFNKVTNHLLSKSANGITQLDVLEKVHSINEQFKRSSLPIDFENTEPTDDYVSSQDDRLFVHQLNLLKVSTKRIQLCISDFYKAFEQRSRWVREQLLIDDELVNYEMRLVREWDRYVTKLGDNISPESDDDLVKFGKQILDHFETVNIPIRKEMPTGHEYVMRGSYHILADFKPPRIYWHPKCLEKLDELIGQLK